MRKNLGPAKKLATNEGHSWALIFFDRLISSGVPFLCFNGTLLGIVRDNSLIPWDDDVDFVVPRNWLTSEKFLAFRETCINAGYIVRMRGGPLFLTVNFFNDGYKATLSTYIKIPPFKFRAPYRLPSILLPDSDFHGPRFIHAMDRKWPVPVRAEELLEHVYGNWQAPVQSDDEKKYTNQKFRNPIWLRHSLLAVNRAAGLCFLRPKHVFPQKRIEKNDYFPSS